MGLWCPQPQLPVCLHLCAVYAPNSPSSLPRGPERAGGPGGGGTGGGGPAVGQLAGDAGTLPGSAALLGHHLLAPRLQHPPEAVGARAGRGPAAEHAVLTPGRWAAGPPKGLIMWAWRDMRDVRSLYQIGLRGRCVFFTCHFSVSP